ncbi:NAD(P)H-binding protein [Flavobacterium sp. Sd200]|uniref:SDR family oxidoreductase n=1 Tax=Flavobacterium sp. Sd200 TaxID=2692211 RepID=UPI001367F4EB|nr:SDR family oxidoreductase [Flavobacterium sp. Sd200]MXN91859.1 NAD(P)H-binding protein [Flavobacterium sp. Sd200]
MQISILGCGWLGLPLAKAFITQGVSVKGSITSPEKLSTLKQVGIEPYLINLSPEAPANLNDFLSGSGVLIISIPPKLRSGHGESYTDKIEGIIPQIEKSSIGKVLFVSSTSVYADDNTVVTEDTLPNPETESGRQILEAEQILSGNTGFKTTVLRFAGLIGPDRHPIKQLAGKQNLANPLAPVNLIHQDDCIGIILKIIEKNIWGENFNAAYPLHPVRELYYTQKAVEFGLPAPTFNSENASVGKTILSDKLIKALNYKFSTGI